MESTASQKRGKISIVKLGLLALLSLLTQACGVSNYVAPLEPSGFIKGAELEVKDETLPFKHSYLAKKNFASQYKEIIVAPVSDAFLDKDKWVGSSSLFVRSKKAYGKKVEQLAKYTSKALHSRFNSKEGNRFRLVSNPGRETLLLEVALTEVTLGDPLLHAATTALPIMGGSQLFSTLRNPTVGFEAVLKDSITGEVIATFADRGVSQLRLIDLNKFTVSSANHEIIDYLVRQLALSLNRKKTEVVHERLPLTLAFW